MTKNSVLADHKKQKNKFIPPAIHLLGGFVETSWIKEGLPELIWLRLLNKYHGVNKAAEIALSFTKVCIAGVTSEPKPLFGFVSSFKKLSPEEQREIRRIMQTAWWHAPLVEACGGLLAHYPACPLRFIAEEKDIASYKTPERLEFISSAIEPLFSKYDEATVFTQSTFYFLGVMQNKIHVAPHLTLAKFPEIQHYPNTELSRQIASGIRAFISSMMGKTFGDETLDHDWANYFWDRGMELSSCRVRVSSHE